MITAKNLSMRFGAKILFKETSFQLNPGQHYGLVGANGSGKSTLIKILSNDVTPESGETSMPTLCTLGVLKQNHFLYENEKILDVVIMGKPSLFTALKEKEQLLQEEEFTETTCLTLEELEKTIAIEEGYQAEAQAAKLLEGLGIANELHEKPLHVLSGGYKLRVLLAQVLFSNPSVLLLDEPTNHLDIFSIHWLENYLISFPGTILLSSHDKQFLNRVCNFILDLDHQTIKIYKGNYDAFIETKTAYLEQMVSQTANQTKKRDDLQEFITRFKAKASKATQAQSKMKLVEKLEAEMESKVLSPSSRIYPHFHFDQTRPSGAIPLTVKGIHKSYGDKKVLSDVSFEVHRKDRIAILGANGIGKSTLLELLCGFLEPTKGSFEWGHAAQNAYFAQDHKRDIKGDETLLDWMLQFSPQIPEQTIRSILGKVLFSGDDVKKQVRILSGGEIARLIIAKMMLLKQNVLIFDEPTNHLDMEATDALLEALQAYEGTLIFVSHNRYFISSIATRIIEITTQGVKDFNCSYSEYMEKRELDLLSVHSLPKKEGRSKENPFEEQKEKRKSKNQLEKKLALKENECHVLEEKIKLIQEKLILPNFYEKTPQNEIAKLLKDQEIFEKQLKSAFLEWEVLSEALITP